MVFRCQLFKVANFILFSPLVHKTLEKKINLTHFVLMDFKDYLKAYKSAQAALCEQITTLVAKSKQNSLQTEGVKHFKKHSIAFKVALRNNRQVAKIKYMDYCKFTDIAHYASRGTTFWPNDDEKNSATVLFSLNKFFNRHEMHKTTTLSIREVMQGLEADGFLLGYMPKYDGTNMHVFYDDHDQLNIFTLGSLEEIKMGKANSPAFSEATKQLLMQHFPLILPYLKQHPLTALVCELMTEYNKIITHYNTRKIMPLVLITPDGVPTWQMLGTLAPQCFHAQTHLPLELFPFNNTNSDEVFNEASKHIASCKDAHGDIPEGFVGYAFKHDASALICLPFEKRKREEYMFVFHGGVAPGSRKDCCNLQKLSLEHKSDDIQDPVRKSYIQSFEQDMHMYVSSQKFHRLLQRLKETPLVNLNEMLHEENVPRAFRFALRLYAQNNPVQLQQLDSQNTQDTLQFLKEHVLMFHHDKQYVIDMLTTKDNCDWLQTLLAEK